MRPEAITARIMRKVQTFPKGGVMQYRLQYFGIRYTLERAAHVCDSKYEPQEPLRQTEMEAARRMPCRHATTAAVRRPHKRRWAHRNHRAFTGTRIARLSTGSDFTPVRCILPGESFYRRLRRQGRNPSPLDSSSGPATHPATPFGLR